MLSLYESSFQNINLASERSQSVVECGAELSTERVSTGPEHGRHVGEAVDPVEEDRTVEADDHHGEVLSSAQVTLQLVSRENLRCG